jgi:hypothetical protein
MILVMTFSVVSEPPDVSAVWPEGNVACATPAVRSVDPAPTVRADTASAPHFNSVLFKMFPFVGVLV